MEKSIGKYRTVPCATLGTNWRDIEDGNGNLFAAQVPTAIAEKFVEDAELYSHAFLSVEIMRGKMIENFHQWLFPSAYREGE